MLARGRRRGMDQQQLYHPHELSDDHHYPSEEMPHRRKESKSSHSRRRSLALNVASAATFVLGLLQVATWNQHENEGISHSSGFLHDTIGGMTEPTQLASAKQSSTPSINALKRRHLREVSSSGTSIPFPKTLVGIFTTLDDPSKDWHRQNLARHPKQICAFGDFELTLSASEREGCQVIYTFVMGGNTGPNAPTELLTVPIGENSRAKHHSLLVKTSGKSLPKDVHENDCTLLNIR